MTLMCGMARNVRTSSRRRTCGCRERSTATMRSSASGWASSSGRGRISGAKRPELLAQPLALDRIVAVLRSRHPQVRRRLDVRTFLAIPHISVIYPGEARAGFFDSVLASRGLERRVALTVAHWTSVPALVADSDLLGLVPERLARTWERGYGLRVHELPVQ